MDIYKRIVDLLTTVTLTLASLVLFSTMAVVSVSVLGRVLFRSPIGGLTDIISMLNALAVAFAVSVTEKKRKHIKVDFVR